MASVWHKSLMYLGLVDEEQLEDEAQAPRHMAPNPRRAVASAPGRVPEQGISGKRVEPPSIRRAGEPAGSPRTTGSAVRPVANADSRCDILEVTEFDHAKLLADRIRDRTPVILNLRDTEPEMVRRVIDFSTGLTYALDGSMRKTAEGVILVLPPRVSLGREEKQRLADMGLYDIEASN